MSAIVGKTTREAVTRNWGRTRELFGGARSHTARLEERPLLSETDARMLDPERVVIVAGSQQPILARRVKYYEDRAFRDAVLVARARKLPWPEREATPPTEPNDPEGLSRIVAESDGATEALAGGSGPAASSNQRRYPLTCAHSREVMEAARSGMARSALQASQPTSTMASQLSKTRFARRFWRRNCQTFSTGVQLGAVVRERQHADAGCDDEVLGGVPSGAIEDEDRLGPGG